MWKSMNCTLDKKCGTFWNYVMQDPKHTCHQLYASALFPLSFFLWNIVDIKVLLMVGGGGGYSIHWLRDLLKLRNSFSFRSTNYTQFFTDLLHPHLGTQGLIWGLGTQGPTLGIQEPCIGTWESKLHLGTKAPQLGTWNDPTMGHGSIIRDLRTLGTLRRSQ